MIRRISSSLRATLRAAFLLGAVGFVLPAAPPKTKIETSEKAANQAVFDQVDEMLQVLTDITGWDVKVRVPSETLPRKKFAEQLEEGVAEAEKDKEVRGVEMTLKMFGLAPWDYNLARQSADLLEEQAAAFYDHKKKRLFLLESAQISQSRNIADMDQKVALVHELAHALADQHYHLDKYLGGTKDDDAATARQSVVEGQASWLSWAYLSQATGGKPEVPQVLVQQLADSAGATGEQFPEMAQAPLYIRESLVFPYTEGMRFQDAVYRRLGKAAFDEVFQHPPRSTQEILHPDLYMSEPEEDQNHKLEAQLDPLVKQIVGKPARDLKKVVGGAVGEFDYSVLLRQYLDAQTGREASTHWVSGAYRLYEHKKTKQPVLAHVSEWDSADSAREFFSLYSEVLRKKWKNVQVARSTSDDFAGTGDTGDFSVRLVGSRVEVVEGVNGHVPGKTL